MIAAASGQTRRLMSLNEEVRGLRILIGDLNKLLTAIMEGSITMGQDAFNNFVIERIANLSSVSEEQKAILKIYVRLAYGGQEHALTIPFPFAKKHNLFLGDVNLLETIARSEYERRRRETREDLDTFHEKHIKWLTGDTEGKMRPLTESVKESIQNDKAWREKLWSEIDDHESYGKKWRKELAPAPFPVRIDQVDRDKVIGACIKELEGDGQKALEIVQDFVRFCMLLAEPENCIKVKSGQYTEREVNARTELDMIGERARELMALPKYTVYIKKLDSEHGTKVCKTNTKELPKTKADYEAIERMIEHTRETVCRLRRDIQDEIYNRQMPVIEDSGPPSPYD